MQLGQIVEDDGDRGMIGPSRLLDDGQAALVERLGLGVAALRTVEEGEVVERDGSRGMIGPVEALGERKCLQRDGYSLIDLAGQAELIDLRVECAELVSRLGENCRWRPCHRPRKSQQNCQAEPQSSHHISLSLVPYSHAPDTLSGRNSTAS
jgi:hypothetical protein